MAKLRASLLPLILKRGTYHPHCGGMRDSIRAPFLGLTPCPSEWGRISDLRSKSVLRPGGVIR